VGFGSLLFGTVGLANPLALLFQGINLSLLFCFFGLGGILALLLETFLLSLLSCNSIIFSLLKTLKLEALGLLGGLLLANLCCDG
jgi:hypothetical protein